jgi:hypothetical protein
MTSFVKSLTYDKDLKHPFIKGLFASLVAIAEKENFKLYEKAAIRIRRRSIRRIPVVILNTEPIYLKYPIKNYI